MSDAIKIDAKCPLCGKPAVWNAPPEMGTYLMPGDDATDPIVVVSAERCCTARMSLVITLKEGSAEVVASHGVRLGSPPEPDRNGMVLY